MGWMVYSERARHASFEKSCEMSILRIRASRILTAAQVEVGDDGYNYYHNRNALGLLLTLGQTTLQPATS